MRGNTETQEKVGIALSTNKLFNLKRIGFFLWVIFTVVTLAIYYRQVWHVFSWGPVQWVQQNYSLYAAIQPVWRFIQSNGTLNAPGYLLDALKRGIWGFAGLIVILACAYFLGYVLLKLLRVNYENALDGLLFSFGIGFGALSYTSLLLANFSLFQTSLIRVLLLSLAAIAAAYTLYWFLTNRNKVIGINAKLRSPFHSNKPWKLITALAVGIALIGALAPEIEYDALWYHLWLPQQWMQQGSPVDIVHEYISLYPLTWDLIYGLAMTIGGSIAAKLVHFSMLPLSALLVYQITRLVAPSASPWIAVALFVTIPTILWQATTTYVDLALTFYIGITVYTLLLYKRNNHLSFLILAAVFLGLAMAIKHLSIIVWLILIIGMGFVLWQEQRSLHKVLKPILILAGVSVIFPIPWYLRSFIASGNPVFPDLYPLFGAFPNERWSQITEKGLSTFKDNFGYPRTTLNLVLLPWNLTVHGAKFGGSLGPLLLIFVSGIFISISSRNELRWLGLFSLLYIIIWASPISSFQMRFILPITPFLVVISAAVFNNLTKRFENRQTVYKLANFVLLVLLILNLPPFTSLHESDREQWNGWLTHVIHEIPLGVVLGYEDENQYLSRKVPSYRAWNYINNNLDLDSRVLTFSGGDHLYSDRDRI